MNRYGFPVSWQPYYTINMGFLLTGAFPAFVIMTALLSAAYGFCQMTFLRLFYEAGLCTIRRSCLSDAYAWPYAAGIRQCQRYKNRPEISLFCTKLSHIFRWFHRSYGFFWGYRQTLHQPAELLLREGTHFLWTARPLETAF